METAKVIDMYYPQYGDRRYDDRTRMHFAANTTFQIIL